MTYWILMVIPTAVFMGVFFWGPKPRTQNQTVSQHRLLCIVFLIMSLVGLWVAQSGTLPGYRWLIFAGFGLVALSEGYAGFIKQPTPAQMLTRYAEDSQHCGQCRYNLTANTSGICPECGWTLPQMPFEYQRTDVWLWWKRWRIDYLDSWKKMLVVFCFNLVLFVTVPIILFAWLPQYSQSITTGLLLFMAFNILMNIVRIIQYAKRESSAAS